MNEIGEFVVFIFMEFKFSGEWCLDIVYSKGLGV